MTALAIVLALHALPDASRAGAPQPVSLDCNVGPLVLDAPGSYVLTNGTVNCALSEAIRIPASKVVLDLGGHQLDGVDQNGTFGILVTGEKVVLRNGSVQDFGTGILHFGSKGVIDGIAAVSNTNDGMEIHDATVVSNSRAQFNVGDGLEGGDGNVLRRNVFAQNGAYGVFLDDGNTLVENTASANGVFGFALGDDNKLLRNVAAFNGQFGFESFERSLFKGNTAASNGGHGIHAGASADGGASRLTANVAIGNGGIGLYVDGKNNLVEKNRGTGNQGGGFYAPLPGTFKGNEFSGNAGAGMLVGNAVVIKNTCIDNQWGIATGDNVESVVLTANVAVANSEDGIFIPELLNPSATQIVKNVVIGNGQQGIDLPAGATPVGVGKNTARGNLNQLQCDADLCRE